MLLPRTAPTRHSHLPRAPRSNSNQNSPGWGPPPKGDRQDRASAMTLPQYHVPRRYTSPSRQEPVRAPRGKDHRGPCRDGKPLEAPVGGDSSRGNTLLPSARGSFKLGCDSESQGQLTTPSNPDPSHRPATRTRRDAAWAQVRLAAPAEWLGGFGTCDLGGSQQTRIPHEPRTKDTIPSSRARRGSPPSHILRQDDVGRWTSRKPIDVAPRVRFKSSRTLPQRVMPPATFGTTGRLGLTSTPGCTAGRPP
jgi:hypothetical protein